ncbi:MAG: hypothetical protein FWD44_01755 [Oscillospiraceae bacterium]|nr:hypothetical protein [Oscillospiraceae bacterium]
MEKSMFTALLPILIGGLVIMIIDETNVDENSAFEKLYSSKLYEYLESEETKVWTYSVPLLFSLYQEELATGILELPEY